MMAIIVITLLVLIGAVYTVFLKQRTSLKEADNHVLQAPRVQGLFDYPDPELPVENPAVDRKELIERAKAGELETLSTAHASGDAELYKEVVNALCESSSGRQENLSALVTHISNNSKLRATRELAERLIEACKTAPDRRSTTAMIHIAALSDDAQTYEQAIETALEIWRAGGLAGFSSEELAELLISQYWIIAPQARGGGIGFALKRRLLGIRRELATAAPVR